MKHGVASSGWPPGILRSELGKGHQRPMDTGHRERLQTGVQKHPTRTAHLNTDRHGFRKESNHVGGGQELGRKRSNNTSARQQGFDLLCPKIRRIMVPSYQPEGFQPDIPLQDGVYQNNKGADTQGRLVDKIRSEGRIFDTADLQTTPKIFMVQMEKPGLSSAPQTFTKLTKPVVSTRTLRKLGIRVTLYLDDMLIMTETKQQAERNLATAMDLLVSLGST